MARADVPPRDQSNTGVRRYVVLALIFGAIGAVFTGQAITLRVKQRIAWTRGFGEFDTDLLGSRMPIDAAVGWLHTFSVPFWVLTAFAVYRIICRWGAVGN
jgi:hypothetical protein